LLAKTIEEPEELEKIYEGPFKSFAANIEKIMSFDSMYQKLSGGGMIGIESKILKANEKNVISRWLSQKNRTKTFKKIFSGFDKGVSIQEYA